MYALQAVREIVTVSGSFTMNGLDDSWLTPTLEYDATDGIILKFEFKPFPVGTCTITVKLCQLWMLLNNWI